jgi:hypothetical protein
MNKLSSVRDRTHIVRSATPTPPMELLFIGCHHKGVRTGALMRGKLPMLCPKCNSKEKT